MHRQLTRLTRRAATLSILVAGAAGCTATVDPPRDGSAPLPDLRPLPAAPVADPLDTLRYHEWTDVACHNCYAKGFPRFGDALRHTRTLEIDITDQPVASGKIDIKSGKSTGIWFVRHDNKGDGGIVSNNVNHCGTREKVSTDLLGCLGDIRRYMDADTNAHVLTLYLDLKISRWSSRRSPAELDSLLASTLLERRIFRPAHMLPQSKPAPVDSARARMWPRLSELRGKIIVVLTGGIGMEELEAGLGTLTKRNRILDDYMEWRGDTAVAFVGAEVSMRAGIRNPRGIDKQRDPYIAFYNFGNWSGDAVVVGEAIRDRHGVGRIWWKGDSNPPSTNVCKGFRARFQRPAVDAIDKVQPCAGTAGT